MVAGRAAPGFFAVLKVETEGRMICKPEHGSLIGRCKQRGNQQKGFVEDGRSARRLAESFARPVFPSYRNSVAASDATPETVMKRCLNDDRLRLANPSAPMA